MLYADDISFLVLVKVDIYVINKMPMPLYAISLLHGSWKNSRDTQSQILNSFKQAEESSYSLMGLIDQMVKDKHPTS